ncbi:MAG: glycosyltransferase family 39 protein [Candidatus Eisenbacteria bacterium]
MKPGLVSIVVLVWLGIVTVAFGFYQFAGFTKANPLGDYLSSAAAVIAITAVATALGLRLAPDARPNLGTVVTRTALGLALLGVLTLFLAALGMLRPYVVWPAVAALAAVCWRQITQVTTWFRRARPQLLGGFEFVVVGLAGFASLVLLVNCLAPLTANDALVYHLNLPKIYTAASGLTRLPYNVYANMPHYGEMLYTLFYSAAGETACRMFYFLMVMGATASVYALARRFISRKMALAAAGAFLVEPLVLDHRTVCNVDVLLAYFFVSALIFLFDLTGTRPGARSVLGASVLAGFMLGTKYTAIAPASALLAVPLISSPKRPSTRVFVIAVLVAAAIFAPWVIKNEAYVGSPFYPLFEGRFDGANWDSAQERELVAWQRSMGMGRSLADYLLLPLNASVRGKPEMGYSRFDGTMTPLLLILLPLALLKRTREVITLVVMMVGTFVFWALVSQQLRFLLPTIALAAVLAGMGLANLQERIGRRQMSVALAATAAIMAFSIIVPDQYGKPFVVAGAGDKLGVVLGLEPREQYLERNIQSVAMSSHVRKSLPRREPIFMVWENRGYYFDNPYFADSFFEVSTLMRMVSRARDGDELARAITGMGFRYVVVNDWLGDYFLRYYPPADAAKLKEFIMTRLQPVHSANRMTLYSIR